MSKEQKIIKLTGKHSDGGKAKYANKVSYFHGQFNKSEHQVTVFNITDKYATVATVKGQYTLTKHDTLNIYQGECNGIKVHFTKKKIVAQLIYWA